MRILFTKNTTLVSRLIRAITKEPVSHCALQCGPYVIHCNFYGLNIEIIDHFLERNEVIYATEINTSLEAVVEVLRESKAPRYDFLGLLYLALRYLIPFLPKKNLWQMTGMFLCTEFITHILYGQEDSLLTPYKLYLGISK